MSYHCYKPGILFVYFVHKKRGRFHNFLKYSLNLQNPPTAQAYISPGHIWRSSAGTLSRGPDYILSLLFSFFIFY